MIIENSKTYGVNDVEELFFRPSFCGKAAEELGIRVLYNMPYPTKVPLFTHNNDIIKSFASGWQGGNAGAMEQKTIELSKLKAESSYSAEDYFSTLYELITNSAEVNLGDLTGTDLEKAETELFRRAIAESIYAGLWYGDTTGDVSERTGFTGFISYLIYFYENLDVIQTMEIYDTLQSREVVELLRQTWSNAPTALRDLASDGELAYFVSSDIYDAYQFFLDDNGISNAYAPGGDVRPTLYYHGIPLVEVPTARYAPMRGGSFCLLTDRRNLVLALNTADSPEKEIRMWYNPDEMENRQRVVFLAGTTIVDEYLISCSIFDAGLKLE